MAYLEITKELKLRFATFDIKQIPRDQNVEADALAALGATFKPGTIFTIPIVHVLEPTISKTGQDEGSKTGSQQLQEAGVLSNTINQEEATNWRKPYQDWLQNDILPAVKKEEILRDRSVSNKALRQGYFWPTIRKDVMEYAKKCDAYQRHAPVSHQPVENLHPVISPWPFIKWGMDIVGPLPKAPGNKVYMLAMTDYFSKWIEAESFSQKYTPRNPQSNGQAESNNKIIVENLRKKLEEIGGKWAEELPLVLWADRTAPKVATGQTPFSLVFRAEAVIPSEVKVHTHRYECLTEERNQVEMASNLDTVDELRTSAQIRMASYRQTVARSYNKNVKVGTLQVGDLVLRKVF
ncbi:uncharacterized protein LOC141641478 [Silene latifolia]|uniref:uncharacterized protein LOC141641478 n=1 Tax=Silene latifolia TaxID=37657 RepID=UPI003D776C5A